jgi:hypothetical protein
MITMYVFIGLVWFSLGVCITTKIAYFLEDKFDWCGACINLLLLFSWVLLSISVMADLSCGR